MCGDVRERVDVLVSAVGGQCLCLVRIVVVKQMGDVLRPLNTSGPTNVTLVDMVMRSILPSTHHVLSAQEVAVAIETHLQTTEDTWPSWTVSGTSLIAKFA